LIDDDYWRERLRQAASQKLAARKRLAKQMVSITGS